MLLFAFLPQCYQQDFCCIWMRNLLSAQGLFQNTLLTMQKSSHLGGPTCHSGHTSSQSTGYLCNHLVRKDGPESIKVRLKNKEVIKQWCDSLPNISCTDFGKWTILGLPRRLCGGSWCFKHEPWCQSKMLNCRSRVVGVHLAHCQCWAENMAEQKKG